MIEVQNLVRKYGDFTAVDHVSFTIPKGEVIGLLGHNGAGKTTVMKVITGYLEPTSGSVKVDSLDVTESRIKIQERIGYLPENCPVYYDMTIVQYLEYVANLRGIPAEDQSEAIRESIERTQLQEKATDLISTLSRGYRQRVGVAQAIIHKPQILILDEPTNGLDPDQIQEMRTLIKTLSENATVIISTHIMQEVDAVCDRVLIMARGKLALDEKMEDLSGNQQLKVTVDKDIESVQGILKPVAGIQSVTHTQGTNGHKSYSVHMENNSTDIIPTITKSLVEGGCNVYAIHPESRDLETIFHEVTSKG